MGYNVHNFQSGEKLYASQLNEMDAQIKSNSDTMASVYGTVKSENLFNKAAATYNNYFGIKWNGEYTGMTTSGSAYSQYIPVDGAGDYSFRNAMVIYGALAGKYILLFDTEKNYIKSILCTDDGEVNHFTLTEEDVGSAAYFGYTVHRDNLEAAMFVHSADYPSVYKEYFEPHGAIVATVPIDSIEGFGSAEYQIIKGVIPADISGLKWEIGTVWNKVPSDSTNRIRSEMLKVYEGTHFHYDGSNECLCVHLYSADTPTAENHIKESEWVPLKEYTCDVNGYAIVLLKKNDSSTISESEISGIAAGLSVSHNLFGTADNIARRVDSQADGGLYPKEKYNFGWQINSLWNGAYTGGQSRIVSDYIPVSAGTVIRMDTGCMCVSEFYKPRRFSFISGNNFIDGDTYTVQHDGFVRIQLRKDTNNSAITESDIPVIAERMTIAQNIGGINRTLYTERLKTDIPDYWKSYLDTKMDDIKQFVEDCDDTFIFITDIHTNSNRMISPAVVNYINGKIHVGNVFCGGDIINSEQTRRGALSVLDEYVMYTDKNWYTMRGNHDNNFQGPEPVTEKDFVRHVLTRNGNAAHLMQENKAVYYVDNEQSKTRYIVLDTVEESGDITAQVDWMKQRINELAAGWCVVVMAHMYYTASSALVVASVGAQIKSGLDAVADTANASIAGYISGHKHIDMSDVSGKGYPIVVTTCDAYTSDQIPDGTSRVSGTVTEQAFDIFGIDKTSRKLKTMRIGAGVDREFSY